MTDPASPAVAAAATRSLVEFIGTKAIIAVEMRVIAKMARSVSVAAKRIDAAIAAGLDVWSVVNDAADLQLEMDNGAAASLGDCDETVFIENAVD